MCIQLHAHAICNDFNLQLGMSVLIFIHFSQLSTGFQPQWLRRLRGSKEVWQCCPLLQHMCDHLIHPADTGYCCTGHRLLYSGGFWAGWCSCCWWNISWCCTLISKHKHRANHKCPRSQLALFLIVVTDIFLSLNFYRQTLNLCVGHCLSDNILHFIVCTRTWHTQKFVSLQHPYFGCQEALLLALFWSQRSCPHWELINVNCVNSI